MNIPNVIIAGINTEVGKTAVAALVTEALEGHYWKPIQCGMPSDRDWVEPRLSKNHCCYPETFRLRAPLSPHLAARKEGIRIEAKDLVLPICHNAPLIIEGTGGLLSPLNESESWVDAALPWKAQWIIVHRHYLGSLNHFFLTMESLRLRKLPLLGVVFNGEGDRETEEMLIKRANTRFIGRLPWYEPFTPAILQTVAKQWQGNLRALLK